MATRLLVPVLPSDRFYDAVVAAGDFLGHDDVEATVTLLFTSVRPPPDWFDHRPGQHESADSVEIEFEPDLLDTDDWESSMRAAMDEAFRLLHERGVEDDRVNVLFVEWDDRPAAAIAAEAAAGAYNIVVLPRALLAMTPDMAGASVRDMASEVQELFGDGVRLMVT